MHSHSDLALLAEPTADAKVMQGVTGEVIGQDGLAYAPLDDFTLAAVRTQTAGWVGDPAGLDYGWRSVAEYLERFEASPPSLNVAVLVPHGNLRMMTVGTDDRPPSDSEMAEMRALVRRGMAEGALGLSTGLTYTPAMYAGTDELVELCAEIVPFGGYFSPHTRSYGRGVMEAYDEMVDVCLRSGAPLHLTHCQVSFPGNEGRAGALVERLAAIDPRHVEVSADSYCYVPGSTYMAAFLPNWAWTGGPDGVLAHLADPSAAERIRHELEDVGTDGFHGCADGLVGYRGLLGGLRGWSTLGGQARRGDRSRDGGHTVGSGPPSDVRRATERQHPHARRPRGQCPYHHAVALPHGWQ